MQRALGVQTVAVEAGDLAELDQQGVGVGRQFRPRHVPVLEQPPVDRPFGEDPEASMAGILDDAGHQVGDRGLRPFDGLQKPAFVGDEQAGDVTGPVVADGGGYDPVERRLGVLAQHVGPAAGVNDAMQAGHSHAPD